MIHLPRESGKGIVEYALILVLVAVVVIIILAKTTANIQSVIFKKKPKEAGKAPAVSFEEGATPVKVYKVKRTDFKDTLPCLGNVKGYKEVDLKFQVAGIVESFKTAGSTSASPGAGPWTS